MTAPTQKLTARAATQLGEAVALAIRVRRGPPTRRESANDQNTLALGGQQTAPATFPAGGLPIVPIARAAKRWATDIFSGEHHLNGVLVFTRAGDRILMGRSRFRSLRPTDEVVRRFPSAAVPEIDEFLLAEELIPELTIDGEHFIVNSVDFKALMKAAVTGEVDARYLATQLKPLYDRSQSLATADPNAIRSAMKDPR